MYLQKVISKTRCKKIFFFASWRSLTNRAGSECFVIFLINIAMEFLFLLTLLNSVRFSFELEITWLGSGSVFQQRWFLFCWKTFTSPFIFDISLKYRRASYVCHARYVCDVLQSSLVSNVPVIVVHFVPSLDSGVLIICLNILGL
jgi:hypothetical protein